MSDPRAKRGWTRRDFMAASAAVASGAAGLWPRPGRAAIPLGVGGSEFQLNAPKKHRSEFKLGEARSPDCMMSAFGSGWNVIYRKKTLEENQYNLRRVVTAPGTGPFKPIRRVEGEVWVMEKNKDYWNKGLPYLDGIEFYHGLPFSPELGSGLLSGRTDYARILDPITARKAKATSGMSSTDFYQSVIQGCC